MAVQRVSAAPREATSPGFFKFFLARDDYCSSIIFFGKDHAFKDPTCGLGGSAAGGRKSVRTIQASVRTASLVLILDRRHW